MHRTGGVLRLRSHRFDRDAMLRALRKDFAVAMATPSTNCE